LETLSVCLLEVYTLVPGTISETATVCEGEFLEGLAGDCETTGEIFENFPIVF
jgi:hypothetical protein